MCSYKFYSINSNTKANLPVGSSLFKFTLVTKELQLAWLCAHEDSVFEALVSLANDWPKYENIWIPAQEN